MRWSLWDGVACRNGTSRGGGRVAGALGSARGGDWGLGRAVSTASSPERETGVARSATRHGKGKGELARGEVGQEEEGQARWQSRGGASCRWAEETAAAAACAAPARLELEEGDWGLICNYGKVQGLDYKLKFPTILGLK